MDRSRTLSIRVPAEKLRVQVLAKTAKAGHGNSNCISATRMGEAMTPERAALIEAMTRSMYSGNLEGAWQATQDDLRRKAHHCLRALEAHFTARGWKVLGPKVTPDMSDHAFMMVDAPGIPLRSIIETSWSFAHAAAPSFPWDGGQSEESKDG